MTRYSLPVILLLAWMPIQAQPAAPEKQYILAVGEANVSVKPDQTTIDIGVVTQGTTAAAAAAQNAKQTDGVLADLRKMVTRPDQLKTTSYSVSPNYQTPKPGGTPTISGYTATNIVDVTIDDLTQVGKVIDAVLQSGANNIQRLQFGLKNPQAARSQALREAAVQARANADAIAAGLGVRVVRVLSVEERESGGVRPMQRAMLASATQVEAGTVDVTAFVTLKVEITQ